MLGRLNRTCQERLIELRDALNHYRPDSVAIPPVDGGTAYWVSGPEELDADRLVQAAQAQGMLIEPVSDYFAHPAGHKNMFRLGITSLPRHSIRPGVELLAKIMRDLNNGQKADADSRQPPLGNDDLSRLVPGLTLLYKTVYGEPCTIEVRGNGKLVGRAGYANEDRDAGKWWIEGDRWFRKWNRWAYGEAASFQIRIEGDILFWLDEAGRTVDTAVIVPSRL